MKLRKILFAITPLTIVVTSGLVPLTSCGTTKKTKPKVSSVEIRTAPINVLNDDTTGYKTLSMEYSQQIYHFNGSEIGYINIEKLVKTQMCFNTLYPNSAYADYDVVVEDEIATITNKFNLATCTIDYNKQTITFSDFDAYKTFQTKSPSPLGVGVAGAENYFASISSKYTPGKELKIDLLSKYNIGIFSYNNGIYVPITLLRNLINPNPAYSLFDNGKGLYQIVSPSTTITVQKVIDLYKPVVAETTVYTVEYLQHLYDVLALVLDNRYGMVERVSRATATAGQTIKFLPNGAYKALEPYHDRLISLDKNTRNRALLEFFSTELDDGGHSMFEGIDILTDSPYEAAAPYGKETINTLGTGIKCNLSRAETDYAPAKYWGDTSRGDCQEAVTAGADNYYEEYKVTKTAGGEETVAYITFDSFAAVKATETLDTDEQAAGRVLPDPHTVKNNCWQDTFRLVMYANKQIKDNNIKKVVLDLSANGGGSVATEHFMASWLCGGIVEKIYNPITNAYCEYTVKADINGDKQFTTDDYIGDDVQLYVITSNESFSCGNALPCNIADARPSTVFIGEQSGGGACWVLPVMELGLGDSYKISDTLHLLRSNSSYNNYITSDTGCPVDYYINAHDDTERAKFYDRTTINQRIVDGQ